MSDEFAHVIGSLVDWFKMWNQVSWRDDQFDGFDSIADLLIAHAKDKQQSIDIELSEYEICLKSIRFPDFDVRSSAER